MKRFTFVIIILLSTFLLSSFTKKKITDVKGTGKVSWYGPGFHGKRMANGKIYNQNALTCATTWNAKTRRKGFPFGTKIKITNIRNGKSVVVTVTDTGGFAKHGRKFDLSKGAFKKIASLNQGILKIKYEVVK
ncbi:MAG: hypothetical protein CSA38_03620 [Flavobacteriales bacterium]|nr:MAG: hypothetical protein CSA38_03620 [Flavobacteriales bacterium]